MDYANYVLDDICSIKPIIFTSHHAICNITPHFFVPQWFQIGKNSRETEFVTLQPKPYRKLNSDANSQTRPSFDFS